MLFPISKINEFFGLDSHCEGLVSIFGDFGVGKTTLTLQAALQMAGLEYKVLYIYSKPIFPLVRLSTLIPIKEDKEKKKKILENIKFIRIDKFDALYDLIFKLEFQILSEKPKSNRSKGLIIIDSLTELMRLEWNPDSKKKNIKIYYQLNQSLATLAYLNKEYECYVLIVNEISKIQQNQSTVEVQSGRKVMENWITYSIHLIRDKEMNKRQLLLKNKKSNQEIRFSSVMTKGGFI